MLERLKNEPAAVIGALQALLALAMAFGANLTPQQVGAILAATAAILALVTRQLVTPTRTLGPGDGNAAGGPGGPAGSLKSSRPPPGYSTPMVAGLLGIFLIAFTGFDCAKAGNPPITWPDVVQCTGDPLEIAGDVADVLINDIGGKELSVLGRQKLESLAATKGIPAVLCIVDRLVREWVAPAAAPDPHRIAGAVRGESFLRTIGTKVERK